MVNDMSMVLTGISHKTAPVEVRERLALTDEACAESLSVLVDGEVVREALILSTCNRVEVLATINPARLEEGTAHVSGFFSSACAVPFDALRRHLYTHEDMDAVRHILRVASSLDSMVVGEPQVLGQVRRAYTAAVEAGTAGRVLHRLMHTAFHTAKRVRSETGVAGNAVSISYTAVELGRKIFGSLEGRTVMLVGAGEMAELAARHLVGAGATRILVTNRTDETARRLAAEFGGEALPYENFAAHLSEADIVICSTGAGRYLLTPEMARTALELRRNRPAFFIDISVPRNIDPAIGEIGNLFVFDVDDLEAVVASNLREREREAARAESIIEAEVARFEQSLRHSDIGQKIGELRKELQTIARQELTRQRRRLGQLTPAQERAVEALLVSAVNKISHPVIQQMRRSADAVETEFTNIWRGDAAMPEKERNGGRQIIELALSES
jgi:glutamyl-tRNA reductase